MSGAGKSGRALAGNLECVSRRQPAGSTLVAFQPKSAKASRPSVRRLARAERAHSPGVGAQVIRFPQRPFALVARASIWAPTGKYANIGGDPCSSTSNPDWRRRTIENVLVLIWLSALMTAGYYMLTALSAVS
jgi:hypothetical protein